MLIKLYHLLSLSLPLAQVGGGIGIIQDSTEKLEAVQDAWNERWTDIFDGTNGLYLGITEFAAVIVAGAFIFFAVIWVRNAIDRGILPALPEVYDVPQKLDKEIR